MNMTTNALFLAGDIGGTNTRLALYEPDPPCENESRSRYRRPLFVKEYRNEESLGIRSIGSNKSMNSSNYHDNNDESESCNENVRHFVRTMIAPFLEEACGSDVLDRINQPNSFWKQLSIFCCLGVAGPVDFFRNNGTVTTSQREYLVALNGNGIVEACQRQGKDSKTGTVKACVVINDFVAQGYGCLSLSSAMNSGELQRMNGNNNTTAVGPKFCVGAGTGFGSCYMVPTSISNKDDDCHSVDYACFPSEYGQSDWAPPKCDRGDSETNEGGDDIVKIWDHLRDKNKRKQSTPHIAVEHVVSGIGLANAYECLSNLFPELANENIRSQFYSERDLRGKVVGEHLYDCQICRRAVEAVIRAYGSVVGSCAMSFLPTGGLYVTGGLLLNLLAQEKLNAAKPTNNSNESDKEKMSSLDFESSSILTLFLESYRCKGPASFLLDSIPLYLVLAKDAGLRGAAIRAEMEFKTYHSIHQ